MAMTRCVKISLCAFAALLLCTLCLLVASPATRQSLFGVRLGQKIAVDGSMSFMQCDGFRHSSNLKVPANWDCFMFTVTNEYYGVRFMNHRVFLDRTSRRVIAVLANAPLRGMGPPSVGFTNLLKQVFLHYGHCQTQLSGSLWQSGRIYRTTFFLSPDARLVLSHHQQFGEEICLYDKSAYNYAYDECVLPETLPLSSMENTSNPFRDFMKDHPAIKLYEKYRNLRLENGKFAPVHD